MIKRNLIITAFILFSVFIATAQEKKQETTLKREVTLYNPYKPSLPESRKRSFLPDMNDTMRVKPDFRYDVNSQAFMPAYTVSPIKAAALEPDPLPKLYKSYLNIGLGNYLTPLAELSITNERSKKGIIGFYGRHFSSNGKIKLQNGEKVFGGYMDNDVSLFGSKFFKKSILEGSVDFGQRIRYAYGYDTSIVGYIPEKKDIRIGYNNIGATASLSSLTTDSSSFSYDFDIWYNYFTNAKNLYQHNAGFSGIMAKSYKGFYVGAGIGYDFDRIPNLLLATPKYIASISPFIKKSSEQWNFKLGFQALLDKNMTDTPELHLYPDLQFGFSIVPAYIGFFAELSGKMEKNDPYKVIDENPFLIRDGSLFTLPNTDHQLVARAGLKGNSGLGGNYLLSASYSLVNNMLFYSNIVFQDTVVKPGRGNFFVPVPDEVEILNLHSEMTGMINDKLTYGLKGDFYKYTLAKNDYAWNKPSWDASVGLKYNLKDKILAGMELSVQGQRKVIVNGDVTIPNPLYPVIQFDFPAHVNLNLSAEYRYSNILSFWARLNNISYNRYYEWAYYPSQRFLGMVGFTYSL
jgi:hypothetical protein